MLRVLIAEDEDIIRKGLVYTTDWLSMDCVVVAEAANGQEGLEKILECRPDVVIADICMPFLDGIEMIKKASETVHFKSILLTSYADFEYARRAIDARVCEYMLKPVDEDELADIMKPVSYTHLFDQYDCCPAGLPGTVHPVPPSDAAGRQLLFRGDRDTGRI